MPADPFLFRPGPSAGPLPLLGPYSAQGDAGRIGQVLDPAFPYGEDLLQFLWGARLFDARGLRTTDGQAVDVLKPGRIQRGSGPDLNDALVRIDGQLWAGNVEVHVHSSEWDAHGHQRDPAYNNVVLHVVYAYDSEARTANGVRLPTVELRTRVHHDRIARHRALMCSREEVSCARQLGRVPPERISFWLERVLVERLERKAAEVEALYHRLGGDPAATFHHVLLRGLGCKVNADPFAMLAHALPLRTLLKYRDDRLRTEALLFGQAGLLQVDHADPYPRALRREHHLLARLHGIRPVPQAAWRFGGLRPANFPTVRIAQLAQLVAACDGTFEALLEQDDVRAVRNALDVQAGGYWETHYRFDQATRPAPKRLGRSTADGLIINAIVPYLFALARLRGRPRLADRAMHLLEQLPPEHNAVTESWAALGLESRSAARSQALIELRNAYCAQHKCLFCVIGSELLQRPV